jgi:hypothetical protein
MLRPVAIALAATLAVTPAFGADLPLKAPPPQTDNCQDQDWAMSSPDDYHRQCGSSLLPLLAGAILVGVMIGTRGGGGGKCSCTTCGGGNISNNAECALSP